MRFGASHDQGAAVYKPPSNLVGGFGNRRLLGRAVWKAPLLGKSGTRRSASLRKGGALIVALGLLLLAGHLSLRLVPIPPSLLRPAVQSIALLDRNGIPLREARVAERFSRELALEEVPRHVIEAVLAAEDKRFFQHHGIDLLATIRAAVAALSHGRITSGASTITQQLIKISERRPRTLRAKLIVTATALRLDQLCSNAQI